MAYQGPRPVKVPAKGDAPSQKIGPTPAPNRKYQNPVLTERVEPVGYAMAKNLGPSSVEPGVTLTSPLGDELKRMNALGDGGDHLQDIIEHGTARNSMVDLASKQTRDVSDTPYPSAHGQSSRQASSGSPGGAIPDKIGAVDSDYAARRAAELKAGR